MNATHLDTLHSRATPDTTPLTTVSLAPGTPWVLTTNHIQGRHQSLIHGQRSPTDPCATRKSLFRPCSLIPPENQMTIQVLRCFKLLEPSSSSDEDSDELGGQPQPQQFTMGLVSDCPAVIVHAGKCFKALIDSGVTISLMCTSLYSMIEGHYKTRLVYCPQHLTSRQ